MTNQVNVLKEAAETNIEAARKELVHAAKLLKEAAEQVIESADNAVAWGRINAIPTNATSIMRSAAELKAMKALLEVMEGLDDGRKRRGRAMRRPFQFDLAQLEQHMLVSTMPIASSSAAGRLSYFPAEHCFVLDHDHYRMRFKFLSDAVEEMNARERNHKR